MKRPGIEIKVVILTIFIVAAVVMSGFLVYKSFSKIVNSIHKEAVPEYRLIVIKDISLDLFEIENSIELYTRTKDKSNLKHYETVNKRLKGRIALLVGLPDDPAEMMQWNDSIKFLVDAKLNIWEEIKQIHTTTNNPQQQFDELYSMLEKKEIDTIKVAVEVEPPKKKGIFKKIFGKKDTVTTRIDTTFVEKSVENEEIRDEIQQLETDLKRREQKRNNRELELIEQNIQVTKELNKLIAQFEKLERDGLIEKKDEADRLASLTYTRLFAFSVMVVVLLLIVLFMFFRYLRKGRAYQRVLQKAKHEAEGLARAKEVFMANVSHEMRTPVNVIYGMAEQVLQHKTSAKVKEQLAILLTSAKHLKSIVNDTLDFSKIHAKKLQIEEVDFSPKNLIEEVLNLNKPDARNRNIELFYRKENNLPPALLGDPLRLKQILINIIGNAIKFTKQGSVTLVVKSQKIKEGKYNLHFQIIDTGIGISNEDVGLIFEEFVQVESDFTRKFSGTGLGLSIVKNLVELQSGEISVESELKKGTKVCFHIPYKIGNKENIQQLEPQEITIPEKIRQLTILVVDDEEYNRYLLKVIFERWGVNYHEAKNGEEAVKMALDRNFDVILMDIRMPKLNGVEASKLILKEKPHTSIIAIAAVSRESEKQLCQEAGITELLNKPFTELELLNTLIASYSVDNEEESVDNTEGFDLEELKRLAGGDRDFLTEMIQIFIRSSQTGLKNIKSALKEENWQEIYEAAHKMAAPCKHIGANDLYEQIKQLEKDTNDQVNLQRVPELILSIEKKIENMNSSLSGLIGSGKLSI